MPRPPSLYLPDVPVGAVVRIKHLRGPWRHLGRGWVVVASEEKWADLVPLVDEWAEQDDVATRQMDTRMHISDDGMRQEWNTEENGKVFLAASVAANKLRNTLRDKGAWLDPRCFGKGDDPFFRVTLLPDYQDTRTR